MPDTPLFGLDGRELKLEKLQRRGLDEVQIKHRKRTTKRQFAILESEFIKNNKPNSKKRNEISSVIGMSKRAVQVWFQNRRAKEKELRKKSFVFPSSSEKCQIAPLKFNESAKNHQIDPFNHSIDSISERGMFFEARPIDFFSDRDILSTISESNIFDPSQFFFTNKGNLSSNINVNGAEICDESSTLRVLSQSNELLSSEMLFGRPLTTSKNANNNIFPDSEPNQDIDASVYSNFDYLSYIDSNKNRIKPELEIIDTSVFTPRTVFDNIYSGTMYKQFNTTDGNRVSSVGFGDQEWSSLSNTHTLNWLKSSSSISPENNKIHALGNVDHSTIINGDASTVIKNKSSGSSYLDYDGSSEDASFSNLIGGINASDYYAKINPTEYSRPTLPDQGLIPEQNRCKNSFGLGFLNIPNFQNTKIPGNESIIDLSPVNYSSMENLRLKLNSFTHTENVSKLLFQN
ncbi:Homeobox protein HD-10 [Smittium mucronatum]|uniref:Homeobox protein HD-10 n=1 Tax=Smittium mucronatum TaxID=133383 RepID=A0A1R0H2C7_9FUNG|nr:Homeobox protein HD-10 [Smittium mucronatum]